MQKRRMKSYKQFLIDTENQGDASSYTRIPKAILYDRNLTLLEKVLWIALASFQFTSEKQIFPTRKRLALILGVKNDTYISRLTKRLQDKGYLNKVLQIGTGRVYYEPYFLCNSKEDPFIDSIFIKTFSQSKHNRNNPRDG